MTGEAALQVGFAAERRGVEGIDDLVVLAHRDVEWGNWVIPERPTSPSTAPCSTLSPGLTRRLPFLRWQYCVDQPSPWSMMSPLPHSRSLTADAWLSE